MKILGQKSAGYKEYELKEYDIREYELKEYELKEYEINEYITRIYEDYGIEKINKSEINRIDREFQRRTSILNKKNLIFLGIATALTVAKGILFPVLSEKMGYGQSADQTKRLEHNDESIEKKHRQANDKFREKKLEKHDAGEWIELIYRTPPYDITVGSPKIGRNMEGKYHRIHTLGHDPVLGWLFGTANIMTDVITYEDFESYRVTRKPKMSITTERVLLSQMFLECYEMIKQDYMFLPAAVFAESQHLLSDKYTKLGLPIPVLETISPELAGRLYKQNYDELCMLRDIKIVGLSAFVSIFFNMIIGLVHGLFYDPDKDQSRELYEVRTRKILSCSNAIGSSSNIIYAIIEKKPRDLDLGGLLVTISRLFMDVKFICKIKKEYIESNLTQN